MGNRAEGPANLPPSSPGVRETGERVGAPTNRPLSSTDVQVTGECGGMLTNYPPDVRETGERVGPPTLRPPSSPNVREMGEHVRALTNCPLSSPAVQVTPFSLETTINLRRRSWKKRGATVRRARAAREGGSASNETRRCAIPSIALPHSPPRPMN